MQYMDVFLKKSLISTLILLSFVLESNSTFASSGNWLIGVSGGATFQKLQHSTTTVSNGSFVPAPYNLDTFTIKNPSTTGTIALFGGRQWQRTNSFLPFTNLLLHYEHQSDSNIKGTVQEYGLPLFTNYNYSMKLQSDVIDVIGKFDLLQYQFLLPYVSAGVGIAFNQVSSYNEHAIPPVSPARISPHYNNKTNTNFTYSLGAGIDFVCKKNIWVTLGYQFMDLGKINSGSGSETWSGTKLDFGKLKSHTISGSVTFLF